MSPEQTPNEAPVVHPDQQPLIEVPAAFKSAVRDELGSEAAKRVVGQPERGVVEVPTPPNPTRAINRGLGWTDASKN